MTTAINAGSLATAAFLLGLIFGVLIAAKIYSNAANSFEARLQKLEQRDVQ